MAQGYVYFVSYHLGTGPQQSGIGNVEMVLPRPISRIGQVREIEEWLRQQTGMPHVVVINYQLLAQGPTR